MRRMFMVVIATAAALSTALPASAAPLSPQQASTGCEAYFDVPAGPEPLSACQWDMRAINAGADAWAEATGEGVTVGVIDGGVDFTHPDLAGAIDVGLSCSFIYATTPTADPAEVVTPGDCSDKGAVQDLQGHGTHVATTIAGRLNGIGIAGVAPDATIVALKACTVEGYCFADSVAAALRYAGDHGIDVVNLSLFADPYWMYCKNDADQRAILKTLSSASKYAQQRGVVVVASAGNEATDLSHPTTDEISPDWPPDAAETRDVGNNCQVAPSELPGVVTVAATGLDHARVVLEHGPPGQRRGAGWRRGPDAGRHVRPDPGRLVEHRCDRWVGVLRSTLAVGSSRTVPDGCGSVERRWPRRTWPASPPSSESCTRTGRPARSRPPSVGARPRCAVLRTGRRTMTVDAPAEPEPRRSSGRASSMP